MRINEFSINNLYFIEHKFEHKDKYANLLDWLFIIAAYIVPSYFLGFTAYFSGTIVSLIGGPLISFLIAFGLFFYKFKYIGLLFRPIHNRLLIIVCVYIVIRFFLTPVPFYTTLTVFRHGYITPLTMLFLLTYLQGISNERILRIMKIIMVLTIIQTILFLIQFFSGIQIFGGVRNVEVIGEEAMDRTIAGFPNILGFIFCFTFILLFEKVYKRQIKYVIILFILTIVISYTRSVLVITAVQMLTILLFYFLKLKPSTIKTTFSYIFLFLALIFTIGIISPNLLIFWETKISETINVELEDEVGNFAFRQRLIDAANEDIKAKDAEMFGIGYIRASDYGEYDYTIGTDTHIAPIIHSEGKFGLVIRCIPIIYILLNSFYRIFKKRYDFLDWIIIAIVLSSAVSIVQTFIFRDYVNGLLFIYLFLILRKRFNGAPA